jgi:hypothetical protein
MSQHKTYREYKKLESKIDPKAKSQVNYANPNLLTRKQVMEMLSIGPATLNRWSKQGILKRHGLGRRVYFKEDEIIQSLIEIDKPGYD